jgi:putative transcriptional regulator
LLASFATGGLPPAPSITVSAHVEACGECRKRVCAFEEAEGRFLLASEPAPLAPDALGRLLAQIDLDPAAERRPRVNAQLADIRIPEAAARTGFGPRRWLRPGLWVAPIRGTPLDGWQTFLLRVPARTTIPTHGHSGGELVAVLAGAFQDGRTYAAGDFAEDVRGSDHHPKVASDGPCACLISLQGRVQWRGWAKLIGPVLGI